MLCEPYRKGRCNYSKVRFFQKQSKHLTKAKKILYSWLMLKKYKYFQHCINTLMFILYGVGILPHCQKFVVIHSTTLPMAISFWKCFRNAVKLKFVCDLCSHRSGSLKVFFYYTLGSFEFWYIDRALAIA
jgi:hypothetical protein